MLIALFDFCRRKTHSHINRLYVIAEFLRIHVFVSAVFTLYKGIGKTAKIEKKTEKRRKHRRNSVICSN